MGTLWSLKFASLIYQLYAAKNYKSVLMITCCGRHCTVVWSSLSSLWGLVQYIESLTIPHSQECGEPECAMGRWIFGPLTGIKMDPQQMQQHL